MTTQEFAVVDVVRLQVQEGWPDLPNDVLNPSGEGGAWGWFVLDSNAADPVVDGKSDYVRLFGATGADELVFALRQDITGADFAAAYWRTVIPAAGPGQQVRALVDITELTDEPTTAILGVQFEDPVLGWTTFEVFPDPLVVGLNELPPVDIPEGTTGLLLTYGVEGPGLASHRMHFRDAWMVHGDAADVVASDPLSEPPWVDILGSAAAIEVERDELNLGLLKATLYDSTLDPASTDLIRPGKRCRLEVLIEDEWQPLFRGKLENPSSAYEIRDPRRSDLRRVKIELHASDPAADLANEPRPEGVSTLAELPYVLLGTGVPFNVNGSDDSIAPETVVIVSVNDQASALDQVAIVRDTVLGYAWVDRAGVLQAWDRDELAAIVALEVDEGLYSDANVDFDIERTFNTLEIEEIRINPGTGETETITHGPFVDEAARREWGARKATFKVQGIDGDDVAAYAATVLERNARPVKRINSVTLPIRTLAELEERALLDLYDLLELSNATVEPPIVAQQSRITTLKHRIVIKREGQRLVNRWFLDLEFSTDGNVAPPTISPSPTPGGGRTMAQLLRPIGEVTMWYGAKADIPAGWLPLDGGVFEVAQFPELAELLEATGLPAGVLPNMEDRFAIGAGTKALGTSGGSPVATLPALDVPDNAPAPSWEADNIGGNFAPRASAYDNHAHGYVGGDEIDVLNPWRSMWFIIRAA